MRGVRGNEMTFNWSHPERSQMFGGKCMNGNAHCPGRCQDQRSGADGPRSTASRRREPVGVNVLRVREVFTKQEIRSLPLRSILAAVP